MTETQKAAERFREAVEKHDFARRLKAEPAKWGQLCAAMDVLEDTAMAIAAFPNLAPGLDKDGLYLCTYGVLQSMIAQQDAVLTASSALGLKTNLLDRLGPIRELRNATVGHPTKKERGKERGSFGIVQVSLSASGFEWYPFDLEAFESGDWPCCVAFADLLKGQEVGVCEALDQLVANLG